MSLRSEDAPRHTLEQLCEQLGAADTSLLDAVLDAYAREAFIALGAQIDSDRVIADATRIYSHAYDVWSSATERQRDVLIGFSPELLSVAVDRAFALTLLFEQLANDASSEKTLSDPRQINARVSYNLALMLRDQAKTVLRTIAGRNDRLRHHVDSLVDDATDAESVTRSLDQLAELADEMLGHDGDALSQRVRLARLTPDYVARLRATAVDVLETAKRARAGAPKAPPKTAREVELDFLDGVNLHLLGEVVHAFESAHELDASIPRLSPMATRRFLVKRSKATLAARAADTTDPSPARRG
ncbi:MAG: hypothetical protein ACHREM_09735 [Polyangiales bacterium]